MNGALSKVGLFIVCLVTVKSGLSHFEQPQPTDRFYETRYEEDACYSTYIGKYVDGIPIKEETAGKTVESPLDWCFSKYIVVTTNREGVTRLARFNPEILDELTPVEGIAVARISNMFGDGYKLERLNYDGSKHYADNIYVRPGQRTKNSCLGRQLYKDKQGYAVDCK